MKRFILFILSLSFVFFSCAQKKCELDDLMVYHVSTDSLYNGLNFNDVFEEYRYIPLRQKEGFIIGKIGQILLFENKIIVVSDGI